MGIEALLRPSEGVRMIPSARALADWQPLAAQEADNSISMLDVIGESWDGEGVTAKRVAAALRSIGRRDVVVNINSPGGDMFEGIAIHNQLKSHAGRVVVNVLGMAASAASVIVMAGDEIRMGDGAFLMIHNCWGLVIGNRHDMQDAAGVFAQFDAAMRDTYAARSGKTAAEIERLMDAETWLSADDSIAGGFADGMMASGDVAARAIYDPRASALLARRRVEAALGREGFSRKQRSEMISALQAAGRDAGGNVERDADSEAGESRATLAAMQRLMDTMKGN